MGIELPFDRVIWPKTPREPEKGTKVLLPWSRCAGCGKPFKEGESIIIIGGLPYHLKCIPRKKKEVNIKEIEKEVSEKYIPSWLEDLAKLYKEKLGSTLMEQEVAWLKRAMTKAMKEAKEGSVWGTIDAMSEVKTAIFDLIRRIMELRSKDILTPEQESYYIGELGTKETIFTGDVAKTLEETIKLRRA